MADAEEMGETELPRDLRIILAIQGLRAFAYGFASVLLGAVLAAARLSDLQVGAVLTAMLRRPTRGVPPTGWCWLFSPVMGIPAGLLAPRLSPAVELGPMPATLPGKPAPLDRSRATVRKLAVLFALDSFGGGFVTQTF